MRNRSMPPGVFIPELAYADPVDHPFGERQYRRPTSPGITGCSRSQSTMSIRRAGAAK